MNSMSSTHAAIGIAICEVLDSRAILRMRGKPRHFREFTLAERRPRDRLIHLVPQMGDKITRRVVRGLVRQGKLVLGYC